MKRLKPLMIIGTRPEAIKMAPVVSACFRRFDDCEPYICLTGQHREMVMPVIEYFRINVDKELDVMRPNQPLAELTARCLERIDDEIANLRPDCVVAQGDTTSVLAASLATFYHRLPFVHVEAGLRTGNLFSPWPEELNRRIADLVTTLYCAPTERAKLQLLGEGVPNSAVRNTGNTIIDALLETVRRERQHNDKWQQKYPFLRGDRLVLITGHRRENFGGGIERICQATRMLAERFPSVSFVYPVHLNPHVREPVHRMLDGQHNIHLFPPLNYPEFVWLLDRCILVLTDSGGIQEECTALRKPLIVMRDTTERPEAVESGAAQLVGTSVENIVRAVTRLLATPSEHAPSHIETCPFGDGQAGLRIVDWMLERPWMTTMPERDNDAVSSDKFELVQRSQECQKLLASCAP